MRSTLTPSKEAVSALDGRHQIPFRSAFEARSEKLTGRKTGFTNRQMWTSYGVQASDLGYRTDRTSRELQTTPVQSVKAPAEPRIEPEIMFGLVR
jgi:2-oxo-3-hexenedioate decarboxylase